jgi:hypothetical protein
MTPEAKLDRFLFADNLHDLDLSGIIYTDETHFSTSPKPHRGWFKKGSFPFEVIENYPSKVNVWAAISDKGKLDLYTFRGKMNSEVYQKIVKDKLLPKATK